MLFPIAVVTLNRSYRVYFRVFVAKKDESVSYKYGIVILMDNLFYKNPYKWTDG
ncbi:hypothetical protein BCL90_4428 [Pedobacter alluvionis]|uniref:Uncharacterized protein n=1 Tax=Pedobacter alluvionis TaxID=475253 RepID=A0A497Y060_9SPHI|nr:hypothetical protein BCL90_4428 [Pedobacter alluvionis]